MKHLLIVSLIVYTSTVFADIDRMLEGAENFNKGGNYSIDCMPWMEVDDAETEKLVGDLMKIVDTDTHGKKKGVGRYALKLLSSCASAIKGMKGKFNAELKKGMESKALDVRTEWVTLAIHLAPDAKTIDGIVDNFLKTPGLSPLAGEIGTVLREIGRRGDEDGARALWQRGLKSTTEPISAAALQVIADSETTAKLIPRADIAKALDAAKPAEGRRAQLIRTLGAHEGEESKTKLVTYCLDLFKNKPTREDGTSSAMEACCDVLAKKKVRDERFYDPLKKIEADTASDISFTSQLANLGNIIGPKIIPTLVEYAKKEGGFDLRAAAASLSDLEHKDESLLAAFEAKLGKGRGGEPDSDTIELAALMVNVVGAPARKLATEIFLRTARAGDPEAALAAALSKIGPAPAVGEHWLDLITKDKSDHDKEKWAEPVVPLLGWDGVGKIEKILAHKDHHKRGLRDGLITGLAKLPEVDAGLLEKYLADPETEWPGGFTALVDLLEARREAIPEAKRAEWDRRMNKTLEKRYSGADVDENAVCARVCSIAENADKWLSRNGDYSGPIAGMYLEQSWKYAMLSLYGMFASHAAPYCPKQKLDSQKILATWTARRGWYLRLWNYLRSIEDTKIMEIFMKKRTPDKTYEEQLEKQLAELKGVIDKESYDRALAFLKRTKAGATVPETGRNPAAFYGKAFQIAWYRKMLENETLAPAERSVIEADRKALETALASDLKHYEQLSVSRWGSGINTYAYSLGALMIPQGGEALAPLLASRKNMKDPLAVPYDPGQGEKIGSQFATRRGGAARAVPFYAALSLLDTDAKRAESAATDLAAAQDLFQENALVLALHTEREETHQRSDGLAPYFFHPAAMYQTSLLAKRFDTQPAQKTAVGGQMAVMRKLLMKMSEGKDGDIGKMGALTYPDSKNFMAPILGMSLLPLIQKCEGKEVPRSYGILDARLKPRPVAPAPREKKEEKTH